MGDFFELFFDDAKAAADCLDIALTSRGEHGGAPIPMCGVPVHAAEGYLARLIKAGCRVAIAEQIESPGEAKKRGGSKALVARDIVRFVTAGTLTEEALLDSRAGQRLVALARSATGLRRSPPATSRPGGWSSRMPAGGARRGAGAARRQPSWSRPRRCAGARWRERRARVRLRQSTGEAPAQGAARGRDARRVRRIHRAAARRRRRAARLSRPCRRGNAAVAAAARRARRRRGI